MAGVEVKGAARLSRTLDGAADAVVDLEATNARVAAYWAGRAAAGAPKVSGRLAASVAAQASAVGASVTAAAPYAGPIHYGWAARNIAPNPFITRALDESVERFEREYADRLDKILADVKGA